MNSTLFNRWPSKYCSVDTLIVTGMKDLKKSKA